MEEKDIKVSFSLTRKQFEKYSKDFKNLTLEEYVDLMAHQNALEEKIKEQENDMVLMLEENEKLKAEVFDLKDQNYIDNREYAELLHKKNKLEEYKYGIEDALRLVNAAVNK